MALSSREFTQVAWEVWGGGHPRIRRPTVPSHVHSVFRGGTVGRWDGVGATPPRTTPPQQTFALRAPYKIGSGTLQPLHNGRSSNARH
jgi:hypothetical protein